MGETRFTMLLLTAFAAVSLLLAAVGLYGTLAYLISQRTQESSVRLALGASASQIVGLVTREGALLASVGATLGIVGAVAVARTLRGLLYDVSPIDSATLIGVTAVAGVVAVVAVSREPGKHFSDCSSQIASEYSRSLGRPGRSALVAHRQRRVIDAYPWMPAMRATTALIPAITFRT